MGQCFVKLHAHKWQVWKLHCDQNKQYLNTEGWEQDLSKSLSNWNTLTWRSCQTEAEQVAQVELVQRRELRWPKGRCKKAVHCYSLCRVWSKFNERVRSSLLADMISCSQTKRMQVLECQRQWSQLHTSPGQIADEGCKYHGFKYLQLHLARPFPKNTRADAGKSGGKPPAQRVSAGVKEDLPCNWSNMGLCHIQNWDEAYKLWHYSSSHYISRTPGKKKYKGKLIKLLLN